MFDLFTNKHVKIWLGPLKLQNALRLRNLRNINPSSKLFLIYESRLLSATENQFIQSLCTELEITLLNVQSDIIPQCTTTAELLLIDHYHEAIQSIENGGNLASASDILRWLSPIYKIGIYSDMDVLIDTNHLPEVIKVDKPILFNLGSQKFFGIDYPVINNDILVVVDPIAALPQIQKIQHIIHNGCRLYEQGKDAFSQLKAEYNSLPTHPNHTFWGSLMVGHLPLSPALARLADGKSIGQTRAEIIRLTNDRNIYCDNYRWSCLFYTLISFGSDSLFNNKMKSQRSSLLRSSVIYSTGPGAALIAFTEYQSYPTTDFRDKALNSLAHYHLDLHLQTRNKLPLHSGFVDLLKLAYGPKPNDLSWLQEGMVSIEQYEHKLLAIAARIEASISNDLQAPQVPRINSLAFKLPSLTMLTQIKTELNHLARLHMLQLVEMQHQFRMNTACDEPKSVTFATCANVNGTAVCVQTKVNFVKPLFFLEKPSVPQELHYTCQPSLADETSLTCSTQVTQEMCDQSTITGCPNVSIVPVIATSAAYGAVSASLPEVVGDVFRLLGGASRTHANYATQATNLIFIALTGSWLSAGMGVAAQAVGGLAGLSASNARVLGNTVSHAINIAQNPCPSTLIATGVSYAAGKFGLWAEKKIVQQIEYYQREYYKNSEI